MFNKTKSSLAITLSVAMLATMVTIPQVASAATAAKQLSGADRYATALKIVEDGWKTSESAVIARGDDLADALAAAPLAYAKGKAPILLTKTNEIPAGVLSELKALGVKNVYIVGGVGAVSKTVADELAKAGLTITRVEGKDRYETSLKIANEAFGTTSKEVVIANGISYADALSVSSIAANKGMPILLVDKKLSTEQAAYIAGKTVYAVGGEGVLNTDVVSSAKATRLAGLDRYKTNAAVLAQFKPSFSKIYLAKGTPANLVDSLAGSALAALTNSPIVLVDANNKINAELSKVVTDNIASDSTEILLGGTVTQAAADAVEALKSSAISLKSVSAITAKTIKVTFSSPVDTTKAVFAVKRETATLTAPTVTWNDAKTEATLTLASKISAANYTVSVTGLTTAALTSTFVGTDEKVAKIEILSTDVALMNASHTEATKDTDINDIAVAYKVYNQYNEDITKVTTVIASSSGTFTDPIQSKGIIEISGEFDQYISNKAAVTIINAESGVSATATLNVVAQAKVGEVKVIGLYNKDGKTLSESTNLATDKFYLEIEAKDQYGKVIDPTGVNTADLLYSESNNTKIVVDGTTGLPVVQDTVVDGKYFIQLKGVTGASSNYAKAGESTVTIISRVTGKSNAFTVTVGEGVRANSVTISQPDLVAQNEDAFLPISVFDKDGNEIKDLALLRDDAVRGIAVSGTIGLSNANLVLKDGSIFIKVPAGLNATETINTVVVTLNATYKVTSANYTVKKLAVPKVIVGFKTGISNELNGTVSQAIKASDLVIEDQYGRQMTTAAINTWMGKDSNALIVTSTVPVSPALDTSAFAVTGGTTLLSTQTITGTQAVTVTPNATDATTEKLTFALAPAGVALSSSTKDVVFSKSVLAEYASYRVDAPAAIFNANGSQFKLKVYGVKADGKEVLLDNTKYNLAFSAATGLVFNNAYVNGTNTMKLTSALASTVIDDLDATADIPSSKDFTFTVTIGNDAANQIAQVVKVSTDAQDAAMIGFTEDGINDSTAFDGSNFKANDNVLDATDFSQYAYVKDVYGVFTNNFGTNGTAFDTITFSNLIKTSGSTAKIDTTVNGSATAKVDDMIAGDKVTVTVKENKVVKTIVVTVVD